MGSGENQQALKIVVFGATGMVGQAAVHACLEDPGVASVLIVRRGGRDPSEPTGPKVRDIVHADLYDLSSIAGELGGLDACLFCLGVSSAGMKEDAYSRVTYDLTLASARTLVATSPGMTFIYVSGAGTDGTEKGRSMWARVKGKTENALLALPFGAAYMFRPGIIQPLHGIKSRTPSYRILYTVGKPLFPLLRLVAPKSVLTTDELGRAMLSAVRKGAPKKILESADIRALA
jgi:uncharacterized protein YbjT (DUF2867 family)